MVSIGKRSPKSEAKKLAKNVRQYLPQERFLVAPVVEENSDSGHPEEIVPQGERLQPRQIQGRLAMLHGCPHDISAIVTEQRVATSDQLDSIEKFMITRTLPVSQCMDILWTSPATGPIHANDEH